MAHWEPLAGHPAPHHLEETTMTSTGIAPSSHYYSAAPSSDLPRAGTPLVKTEGELTNKEFADVLFQFASETRWKNV